MGRREEREEGSGEEERKVERKKNERSGRGRGIKRETMSNGEEE